MKAVRAFLHGWRLGVAVAVGASLALAGAVVLPVAAHQPDPIMSGPLFNQNQALTFRWGSGGTPPSAIATSVRNAAADAGASRKSKAPTFAYSSGGASTVYYGADVPCGVNAAGCMRRYAPTSFGVWLRENGHRFDWGTFRWCELSGYVDGCYDARNVVLDELGHVDILAHHVNYADDSDYRDSVVQTYSRPKPQAGYNAHAFGRCDVATLQQQYDVPNWTTLYSTTLDVPTVTTLAVDRTSVPSGGSVRFTASLRTNGTGRLAGNPVASRTVVLQHQSGTSWLDIGTMAPSSTSGSYTKTLMLRTGGSYRATFRTPSNEGLNGSSSGSVTIAVTACTTGPCPLVTDPE